MLLCTIKRTTTNLKTTRTARKIKLYGILTSKELKKKHSSRLVGGAEKGNWVREDVQQGGNWWTGQFHVQIWIKQEEQLGSETDSATQGSSMGK